MRKNYIFSKVAIIVVSFILVVIMTFAMPFYLTMGNMTALIIGVVMFWLCMLSLFALPFYFPLMTLLPGDRPGKTLKKCFVIVSDNVLFSIFFFIYNFGRFSIFYLPYLFF